MLSSNVISRSTTGSSLPGFFSLRIVQGRLYGSLIDVLYRGTPIALVALGMAIVIGTRGSHTGACLGEFLSNRRTAS